MASAPGFDPSWTEKSKPVLDYLLGKKEGATLPQLEDMAKTLKGEKYLLVQCLAWLLGQRLAYTVDIDGKPRWFAGRKRTAPGGAR